MQSTHIPPSQVAYPGAKWWRVDFHTHTPHSTDAYRDENGQPNISNREWLLAHMRKGIDAVCVTDHNGGGQIDALKTALVELETADPAEPDFRPLTIFPGVELTTSDDIHLLAIFGPGANSASVSELIGQIGLGGGTQGDHTLQLQWSLKTILDQAHPPNFDCIFIPAHVNGTRGLISDGNPRTKEDALKHSAIYALECSRAKAVDWTAETEPIERSANKAFAVVYGSDSHQVTEVGRRTTWVHMEAPSLDGLRIALLDGTGSIAEFEPGTSFPGPPTDMWVRKIQITDSKYLGRVTPLTLELNPGLNAIVGGRGSGKSTILEFVRKISNRSKELGDAPQSELRVQHESLLKDALEGRPECKVDLEYDLHGLVSRLSSEGAHPTPEFSAHELSDTGTWEPSALPRPEWPNRYPLRIYSQKQLYGFRKSTAELLAEIDGDHSIGIQSHMEEALRLLSQFIQESTRLAELEVEVGKKTGLNTRKADIERQIKLLEEGGHKEVLQQYNLREKQAEEIKNWEDVHDALTHNIESFSSLVQAEELKLSRLVDQANDEEEQALEKSAAKVSEVQKNVGQVLAQQVSDLKDATEAWDKAKGESEWKHAATSATTDYKALTEKLTAEQVENPELYSLLVEQWNSTDSQLKKIQDQEELQRKSAEKHARILGQISTHRQTLSTRRSTFLSSLFDGREDLKITLIPLGDQSHAVKSLREVLQRADGLDEIESLVAALYADGASPTLEKLEELKTCLKNAPEVAEGHVGFGDVRLGKWLCEHLAKRTTEDWARLDAWFPRDSLKIQIARDGGTARFVDLNRASPGQVATAVLAFLLTYGDQPLFLDQPEDDLDNQMIYRVIVKELRRNKKKRQVVIITHNPNLVVNGNADMIFPLDTSDGPTKLDLSGTLQHAAIRESVCKLMEGGKQALEQRFKRMISNVD